MFTSVHTSATAQLPGVVAHPVTESHVALQHTFVGPTVHVVGVAVHVHVMQSPYPSQ